MVEIIEFASLIAVIVGFLWFIRSMLEGEHLSAILAFFIFVLGMAGNITLSYSDDAEKKEIKENATEITFYLDGTEVEYESINLDLYKWIYDAEKKVVHMTKE